jgi:uncharacterized membrane protein
MKVRLLIGVLVALIVLNLATIGSFVYMRWRTPGQDLEALAPQPNPEFRSHRGDHRRATGPFRPSGDERRHLIGLLSEFRTQTDGIRQKISEDENRVFDLMQREKVPRAQVDSLLEEISRSRLEMRRLAVDKLIESKAHLSPHQQQRFFDSILNTRPGGPMGMGGHRPQRRGQQRGQQRNGEKL